MSDRPILKETDLDIVGQLFGLKFVGHQVDLYIHDDENWHFKVSFHKNWIPDLKRVTINADTALFK